MPPIHPPLSNNKFTLNAWGLAGIFGGEEAISSMALIPLFQGKRWLGWYNSPGSLYIARHFGNLARSQFWERIFPRIAKSPAALFCFDGQTGPRYTAAFSGTEMQTGHLGYLVVERCKEVAEEAVITGRETTPAHVALIDIGNVSYDHTVPRLSNPSTFIALIPIIISVVTCVMCALVYDWYSFSVILLGILANGLATIAIGSGNLVVRSVTKVAPGVPPGDGILVPVIWEDIIVVVKGAESAVNALSKGKFGLNLPSDGLSQHAIGTCSLLLILDFLAQLLLIPQGMLFGQLMFVISLCTSWAYNFYNASFRREVLQADLLLQKLGNPPIRKFRLMNRTSMTVFTTLLMFHDVPHPSPAHIKKILRTLLPNDTAVWEIWTKKVVQKVRDPSSSCLELGEREGDLTVPEKALLRTLLRDASEACDAYLQLHVK